VPRVLAASGPNGWRICWLIFAGATFLLAFLALLFLRNRPSDLALRPLGTLENDAPRPFRL